MNEVLAGDPAVRPLRVIDSAEKVRETTEKVTKSKPPLPPHSLRVRTPSPSLRAASPQTPARSLTASTSPSESGVVETPIRKRKRSGELPEWFRLYTEQANRRMEALEESNRQIFAIACDRNSILEALAESLSKQ